MNVKKRELKETVGTVTEIALERASIRFSSQNWIVLTIHGEHGSIEIEIFNPTSCLVAFKENSNKTIRKVETHNFGLAYAKGSGVKSLDDFAEFLEEKLNT